MRGLSVWIYRNEDKVSVTDRVIESIIQHNAIFFSEYCIVTNLPLRMESLAKNIVTIGKKGMRDFVATYLPTVKFNDIRDHQWSDIGTIFIPELFSNAEEGVIYIDSDFVLSNSVALSEMERHCDKYTNFVDRNFYLLGDYSKYYVNAAVSYMPPKHMIRPRKISKENPTPSLRIRMMAEVERRLSKGLATEYNDIGPRLLNEFREELNVANNVLPNTPRFGEIAPSKSGDTYMYDILYKGNSLGVHLLLSLFKQSHLEVEDITFKLDRITLDLKSL